MPSLELLAAHDAPGGRVLSVRIASAGAASVTLRAPPEARIREVRSGGFVRRMGRGGEDDPYFIRCVGRSCDGATFDILLEARAPTEWTLIGVHTQLPAAAGPLLQARPRHSRPQYSGDATIALRRIRL
jgi:hypothetical protein